MTDSSKGLLFGFIGVAIFALTLPLTRIAVVELNPFFASLGRTVVAGAVAAVVLALTKTPWPTVLEVKQLLIIAAGVIFGFPILSAIAMQSAPASHGGVVLGALPLATAVMSTVFAGERPSPLFWFWAVAGTMAVIIFALWDGGFELHAADLLLLGALLAAAIGYAASGALARRLGGWQVICWALVIALPITIPASLSVMPASLATVSWQSWTCFLYLSLFSQLIGFFFWNKGLAIGGVARVGQVQLLQSFMTLIAAAFINREAITATTVGFAIIVGLCVWFGRKAKIN